MTVAIYVPVLSIADELDCKKIINPSKRLDCFDQVSKRVEIDAKARDESIEKERIRAQEDAQKADVAARARETDQAKEREAQEKRDAVVAAKTAIKALKKIENRVEVGVSYRDYPGALSDVTDVVREFQESKFSQTIPATNEAITEALKHYRVALVLWRDKFSSRIVKDHSPVMGATADLVASLRPDYPDIDSAIFKEKGFFGGGVSWIVYGKALSIIWGEASKSIAKATASLEGM